MVFIPEQYKTKCEPDSTKYGRFLKSYHQKKKSKMNKIQTLLTDTEKQKTANIFTSMTKLDFLRSYLLNEEYTLEDFLTIKNPSLKGFFYETIWDICIKCNVVEGLDNNVYYHMEGKIEDLRQTKDQVKRKLRSLKPIEDMYDYFKTNKVQSGSTGGVSDITLQRKTVEENKKHYIMMSCKFFANEKSVESYDIPKLQHAMKGTNTTFDIVLLVNDKRSLEKKIDFSRKEETKQYMKWIYDTVDLHIYFNRLRVLFKHLEKLHTVIPRTRDEKLFRSYFNNRNFKPLLASEFHHHMFNNSSYGTEEQVLWNSSMIEVLIHSLLLKIFSELHHQYAIVCDEHVETRIRQHMKLYFGFSYATISFHRTIHDVNCPFVFMFTTFDDAKTIKQPVNTHKVVFVCHDVLDVLPSHIQGIQWNIENHLALQSASTGWTLAYKPFLIEQSLVGTYGFVLTEKIELPVIPKQIVTNMISSYKRYGDFSIFTNAPYTWQSETYKRYEQFSNKTSTCPLSEDNISALVHLLFSKRNEHMEDYVFINRMKETMTKGTIVWFLPEHVIPHAKAVLETNSFYETWLHNFKIDIRSFSAVSDPNYDVIIVTDDSVLFDDVYQLVNRCYEKKRPYLVLIDFNKKRQELFIKRLGALAMDIVDPDKSPKEKRKSFSFEPVIT